MTAINVDEFHWLAKIVLNFCMPYSGSFWLVFLDGHDGKTNHTLPENNRVRPCIGLYVSWEFYMWSAWSNATAIQDQLAPCVIYLAILWQRLVMPQDSKQRGYRCTSLYSFSLSLYITC